MNTNNSLRQRAHFAVCASLVIIGTAVPRATADVVVEIRPVQPEGLNAAPYPSGTVIDGNTINLPNGSTRVWFNLFVNWAPLAADMLQATVDSAGFDNGLGTPLVLPVQACTQDTECENALGVGSTCSSDHCEGFFHDCVRTDSICNLYSLIYYGSADLLILSWTPLPLSGGFADPGFPVYSGTFVLEVPAGAYGTYTIDLESGGGTFFLSDAGEVPISQVTPAVINIAGPEPYARLVPAVPQGLGADPYPAGTVIDGDTIYISGGPMRLWVDIEVGGWAPEAVGLCQVVLDPAGMSTGSGSPLDLAAPSCTGDADCESAVGPGSRCDIPSAGACEALYFDVNRSNLPGTVLASTNQTQLVAGFTLLAGQPGVPDVGTPYLLASLAVDVPAGAAGTYSIGIDQGPGTFLLTEHSTELAWSQLLPAYIVVNPGCCLPDQTCAPSDPVDCAAAGGTVVERCLGDCNGDGRDDACGMFMDCNGNGILDECDINSGLDGDCDADGVLDSCEIAAGAPDCDANGVPDDCEIGSNDCNNNGVLDVCETQGGTNDCNGNGRPDSCDLEAGSAVDCNGNGALDACDIADGTSFDVDGNCIPDECDQDPAPLAEVDTQMKSRFISFVPVNAGCNVAVRVTLTSPTPPGVGDKFAAFEGKARWLGPPVVYRDMFTGGYLDNTMSRLQCDPYFMEWGPVGLIHVYGPEVMPDSVYDIQFYHGDCGDVNDPACFSPPLTVHTAHWGDVTAPFFADDPGYQPDIRDVAALVRKFVGDEFPLKTVADLEGNLLNVQGYIDFRDISTGVTAILFDPYPFDGPTACAQDGVVVEIQPVKPEGSSAAPYPLGTSISGHTITLPQAGTRVWLNVYVNWLPYTATSFQATLAEAGLSSGSGSPLVRPVEGCTADPTCEDAYGVGSTCSGGSCGVVFYDCARADSICGLYSVLTGTSEVPARLGWSPLPGSPDVVDPGFRVYTGTIVLDVPEGASGTYTIDAEGSPSSFFQSTEGEIPISALIPAHIVVAGP